MLPLQDNICLDHRYWLGSFRDHSRNYSNHGVPSGVSWEKNRAGHFVRFKGTDLITVADSPEIQLDRGTIIVYGDFKDYASLDRLVSKRDAGGTNYELYFNGTSTITLYDGSNTRNATVSWAGSKYIAVSFSSGEKARAYIDGVYTTEFSDTSVFVKDDAVLYIGNYRTGVFPQSNPYKGVIIYDTVLTDSQIATAYQYTQTETTSISLPKKNFFIPSQINPHEPNLVAAYGMVNIGQKIIELASGGNDGDIIGCMGTLGPAGNALWFNGVSNLVSIPAGWHTDINTSNEFT
ncbi:MAG: hypothetical protein KAS07_06150, partial [Candidatus Pacebacteria bacterium]|nr:hypothetical protein [Candidatus Paceibacterota bacterium]